MRKLILLASVAVLQIGTMFEAFAEAECWAKKEKVYTSCYNTWNPGVANNCGDGCTYSYNSGKLTVTATKSNAAISDGAFSPYFYETGVLPPVYNVEIDGEFSNISGYAFFNTGAKITGKNGVLYINNVEANAVSTDTLRGTVIVNDTQSKITFGPWYGAILNATIILPPTIKSISGWALYGLSLGPNAKIYCGTENCEELFKNVDCDKIGKSHSTQCKNNLNTLLSSGKLLSYPDGCTKMGATGCTKCKNENFKLNDGECDRLRYTPAEAAEVLRNDNTNEVTITFKK